MQFQNTHVKLLLKILSKTSLHKRTHMSNSVNFLQIAGVKRWANRNCSGCPCINTKKFSQPTELSKMHGLDLQQLWNKDKMGKLCQKPVSQACQIKTNYKCYIAVAKRFSLQPVLFQRVFLTSSSKVIRGTQPLSAIILAYFKKNLLS